MNKGICKKQLTVAVIVKDNRFWVGSNWVENEQEICPRANMKSGEGYHLCKEICKQHAHAEVDVCINAGENAKGAVLHLIGHTYCCENCLKTMKQYGIKSYIIDGKETQL